MREAYAQCWTMQDGWEWWFWTFVMKNRKKNDKFVSQKFRNWEQNQHLSTINKLRKLQILATTHNNIMIFLIYLFQVENKKLSWEWGLWSLLSCLLKKCRCSSLLSWQVRPPLILRWKIFISHIHMGPKRKSKTKKNTILTIINAFLRKALYKWHA